MEIIVFILGILFLLFVFTWGAKESDKINSAASKQALRRADEILKKK